MASNVGGIDKALRIAIGLALLALLGILEGNARWWGLFGLVPLATGLMNFCPLYSLFGINTCPAQRRTA